MSHLSQLDVHSGIFAGPEEDTSPLVQEIADFLDMWSCIEAGFRALDAPDQKAFREDKDLIPPVFQGFDGNEEGEYLAVAEFMIGHLERFAKFAGRDLESYHPVLEGYRQVLKAFHPIWERVGGTRTLTVSELRMILPPKALNRHPDLQQVSTHDLLSLG